MKSYENLKQILKNTLLEEASNELMTEVLKRHKKAARKRVNIENKIISDATYRLLPEPECEGRLTQVFDVSPDKAH